MRLIGTSINGAWLLEIERSTDARGFFARCFCQNTLKANELNCDVQQQSLSFNKQRGTLRGLHYQSRPYEETKIVRVTQGRIFDIILDLRKESSTYLQWYSIELSAENHRSIYIPKGVAHGFQTLEANSEVFYQMTQDYVPSHSCGARWNDPAFKIKWPIANPILSDRDANYPNYLDNEK